MIYKPTPLQKIRDVEIGERTYICDFVNLYECRIGADSKVGPFVEIQRNTSIGDRCKISSHSFIGEGVTIEDEVFVGHGVIIVNESYPGEANQSGSPSIATGHRITVKKGASIGSAAIITMGVIIGERALVGAGAVVTTDVPDGETVVGNPSRVLAAGR